MILPRTSAGLLMFRRNGGETEVLLAHPGGPYFRSKDEGAWTIPKGEVNEGEDFLTRARIEFEEELGLPAPTTADWIELGTVKQKGGKIVHGWAFEGDCPADFVASFEYLRARMATALGEDAAVSRGRSRGIFSLAKAREKLKEAQVPFLDRLAEAPRGVPQIMTARPLFLFAPGAGAPSSHLWMRDGLSDSLPSGAL